jgi:Ca2+/Na+ antiporter
MSYITAPSIAFWFVMAVFGALAVAVSFWFIICCIPFLFLGIHYYNKERDRQETKEQKDREERNTLEQSRANRQKSDNLWKTGRKILDFFR